MKKSTSLLVAAGLLVPFLYYLNVFVCGALFPGYSHVTQYVSELGSASARYPEIFNSGVVLIGFVCILAGFGFYHGLSGFAAKRTLPVTILVLMILFGISIIMAGLFPMPDVRHGSYGLGMSSHLIPPLIAAAIWKDTSYRSLAVFLLVNTVVMIAMFVIMMGVGQLLTRANVGLFQRSYSLTTFPWIAVVSFVLLKRQTRHVEMDVMPGANV